METGGNLLLFVEVFVVDLQVVAVPPAPTSPHWDLDTLLRLYKKHHIAVFSLAFPPSGRALEESLERYVCFCREPKIYQSPFFILDCKSVPKVGKTSRLPSCELWK